MPFTSTISYSFLGLGLFQGACDHLSQHSPVCASVCSPVSLQVLEMMTTWGGGVEVVAVALVTEGVEVQGWVATETDPHAEERQTSGNRLKVT